MKLLPFIALLCLSSATSAGSLYGSVGLPGLLGGYALPLSETVSLRADASSIGSHTRIRNEDGIQYVGRLKAARVGLITDGFIHESFRLTGGLTLNDVRLDLAGRGNGSTIKTGNTTYVTGTEDRFDVDIKFPRATPYLGMGYGHAFTQGKGLHWLFDFGLSVSEVRVRGKASGPALRNAVAQADVERELADIRDAVRHVKGVPQLTVCLSYGF